MSEAAILTLDSSTPSCSVAVHVNGQLVAAAETHRNQSHSSLLAPMVQSVLAQAGLDAPEISAIAVTLGPGSYTGLRIGLSTAKGMAFSLGKPLIGLNSLDLLSQGVQAPETATLVPMLDARRMEVYTQATQQHQVLMPTQALVLEEDSYATLWEHDPVYFFGSGMPKARPQLATHPQAVFVDGQVPLARHAGALVAQAWQQQRFEDVAYATPAYLKEYQAKKPNLAKLGL